MGSILKVICLIFVLLNINLNQRFARSEFTPSKDASDVFWKRGVVYQVYPRSIYDSNGDGTGDIKGITAKLDYFVDLGVEMIWLSPVLESPMKDFGYDISNYTAIDPIFGTMEDYENMIKEMHARNIKVVFDFVANHVSDKHEWFQNSLQNDPKYRDYFVWKDPRGHIETGEPIPPNNWVSVFRNSAWEWSEERQQFYLHQFLKEQPDLNYRNPDVVQEMNEIFRFWLDKGVDGFRVDALKYLFEAEDVYSADEPVAIDSGVTDPSATEYLNHTYTVNQPETFEVLHGWRQILESYKDRVIMIEVYDDDVDQIMRYYGNKTYPLGDFSFNFFFITQFKNRSSVTGLTLKENVELWLYNLPQGKWPNWVLGNHDNGRVSTRLGVDLIDALNMYNLLLPGTAVTYYGEEIGMEDAAISFEDTKDPSGCSSGPKKYMKMSRDPARTPMQWDDTKFAGFANANSTWLPVNKNYVTLNVKAQNEAEQSHLKVYKQLVQLRKEKVFQLGTLYIQLANEEILAFIRTYESDPRYLVVINTSLNETVADFTSGCVQSVGTVVLRSSTDSRLETEIGSTLSLAEIPLLGGEGMVLRIEP